MIEFDSVLIKPMLLEMNVKMDGWHHIVFSVEPGSLDMYIDGIPLSRMLRWRENFTTPIEPYWEYELPRELFEI
jgi:hypothetical protein